MKQANPLEYDKDLPEEFAGLSEDHAFHPGELLRFVFLRNNKMSLASFAKKADIPLRIVFEFVNKQSPVTEDIVEAIERVFPGSGQSFRVYEDKYERAKKRAIA